MLSLSKSIALGGGGGGVTPPASNVVQLFSDDFNRGNQNLEASPSWTFVAGVAGGLAIVSNAVNIVDTLSAGTAYTVPDIGSADIFAKSKIINLANTSYQIIRVVDNNNWLGWRYNNASSEFQITYRSGGTLTVVASVKYQPALNDVVQYEQFGNFAVLKINDKVRIGPVDIGSRFPSATKAGLLGRSAAQVGWDDVAYGQVISLAASGKQDILVAGDSLSQGQQSSAAVSPGAQAWPNVLQDLIGCFVYNGGFAGQTSTQIRTRITAAAMAAYWGRKWIIWAGRNNWNDPSTVIADHTAMIGVQTSGKYFGMSILNDQTAAGASGGAQYTTIMQLNSDLASLYGVGRWIDIRGYLVSLGAPGQPYADPTRYAADQIPSALVADGSVHLTGACYQLIAEYVRPFVEFA